MLSLCFIICGFFRLPFNNLTFLCNFNCHTKCFHSCSLLDENCLEVYFNTFFLVEINCGTFQRFITGLKYLSPSHFLLHQGEYQQISLV